MFSQQNYNYEKLCDEFEYFLRENDESITNFNSRISQVYYRYHDGDQPSEENLIQSNLYIFLVFL